MILAIVILVLAICALLFLIMILSAEKHYWEQEAKHYRDTNDVLMEINGLEKELVKSIFHQYYENETTTEY